MQEHRAERLFQSWSNGKALHFQERYRRREGQWAAPGSGGWLGGARLYSRSHATYIGLVPVL